MATEDIEHRVLCLKMTWGRVCDFEIISFNCASLVNGIHSIDYKFFYARNRVFAVCVPGHPYLLRDAKQELMETAVVASRIITRILFFIIGLVCNKQINIAFAKITPKCKRHNPVTDTCFTEPDCGCILCFKTPYHV